MRCVGTPIAARKNDMSDLKARKVVTRSGQGFRGYFPSKKLKRSVEVESLLERDAVYFFEYSPGVASYQEQPELILYPFKEEVRRYYPDFRVVFKSGQSVVIEIKPEQKMQQRKLIEKFEAISQYYIGKGQDFRIFTDKIIRQEPILKNLKEIHSVGRFGYEFDEVYKKVEHMLKHQAEISFTQLSNIFGRKEMLAFLGSNRIFLNYYEDIYSPLNIVELMKESNRDSLFF